MNTKHTPGPWATEASINNEGSDLVIITADYEYRICDVYYPAGHDGMAVDDENELEANARLIAAAPDLLAALKLADRIIAHGGAITGDQLETISNALAKAKG